MSRPLVAFMIVAWLLAGSVPLIAPSASSGTSAAPPKLGDESFGRFEWLNPFPTGNALNDVAWSPDGSLAILVGASGTIILYDGLNLTPLYSNTDITFNGVAWYPTADYALIAGSGGKLLKFQDGQLSEIATGTTVNLNAIDINPNTGTAIIVGDQRTILLFDGETVTTVSSGGNVPLSSVSWEPGGTYALATGGQATGPQRAGIVYQYWPENNTINTVFSEASYNFRGVAFSPNAETAFLSARYFDTSNFIIEGRVLIWNDTGMYIAVTGLNSGLNGVGWSPDGTTSYVLSQTEVYAFDTDGLETSGSPYQVQNMVSISWHPDGSKALLVGAGGRVTAFDGVSFYSLWNSAVTATLNAAAWSPDGSRCVAVGANGAIVVYDGTTITSRTVSVKGTPRNFNSIAWNPDGSYALIVGDAGSFVKYDFDGTIDNNVQSGTVANLRAVAWAPNGSYAVAVGDSGTIRKYSGVLSTPVPSVTEYTLRSVAFRPNDSMALIVGGDIRSVQGPTGQVSTSWQVLLQYDGRIVTARRLIQQGPVFNSISFAPGIICSDGGNITLIDEGGTFSSYNLTVSSNLLASAWIKDRQEALVAGDGGTAALFNYSRKEPRQIATGTIQPFTSIAMRPQGDYALCVGWNGMMMKYFPNVAPVPVVLNDPTDVTDNALDLSWSTNTDTDFNHYEVYQANRYSNANYDLIQTEADRTQTSLLVTDLTKLTTYYFMVRVYDNAGLFSDSNIVSATTLLGNVPPVASVLSSPSSITDSSMTLDWTRNNDGDFARYELHMGTNQNFPIADNTLVASFDDQGTTEYPVSGLSPSVQYFFKLRTYDTGGLFADSNEVDATTAAVNVPPVAVTLGPPGNISDTSMKLSWSLNDDSDFSMYQIFMGDHAGFDLTDEAMIKEITDQSVVSFTVEGLVNNTTYFFRVRVVDTAGLYNDSNEVSATTTPPGAPPTPVTLYPPQEATETTVSLSWSQNNDLDFKQYEVYDSTTQGFNASGVPAATTLVDRTQTDYTVTGLLSDTTYYFKVRVKDTSGLFADSNEVSVITQPNQPPEAVALYWPVNVTVSSMVLEWSPSTAPDFARYELHMSTLPGATPTAQNLMAQITDPQSVVYNVTGLGANTTYYFKVRVFDTGGLYNDSNEVNDTTLGPDLPPVAVVLADPDTFNETTVLLEWSVNHDADFAKYIVHKGTSRGFATSGSTAVKTITDRSLTNYTVSGLRPNTQYYFKIEVQDLAGQSNLSNEVSARTISVNIPPVANAGGDQTVTADTIAFLRGSGYDPDGYIISYAWDFQTDGDYDYNGTNGNTTFIYAEPGIYVATLLVTDNRGATATDTANITVLAPLPANILPIILDAGGDIDEYIGDEVGFSANATDPDGHIVNYQWDFLGDGVFEYSSPDGANTSYVYDTAGNYTAVLKVTDDRGGVATAERHVGITRFNLPPIAVIDSPHDKQKFYGDDVITLSAASSSDLDGDKLTYTWDSVKDNRNLGKGETVKLTLSAAAYLIRLTVSDGALTDTAFVNITVQDRPNIPPTAKIESPANNSEVKGSITISGSAKDDNKVQYVEIRIDPSGKWQKATGTRFWSFELDTRTLALGRHTIYARAYDGTDYSAEQNIVITVANPAPATAASKSFIPGFETGALALALSAALLLILRRRH